MRTAGMQAEFDAIGNAVGRYEASTAGAPAVLLGSHLDTVRNAGRYDGLFGILSAIACARALHESGKRLPFALEVIAFGDEEGVRFGITMSGSRALAGTFDPAWLSRADSDGVSLADALRQFGGDPDSIPALRRSRTDTLAYVESHIEQGPVLLDAGLAVGIVTAIAGAARARVRVTGLSGHSGTVPMGGRRDALATAAEMILAVERRCSAGGTLVGTVGHLTVRDGAANVIPGHVEFTVDVRSGDDATRLAAVIDVRRACHEIALRRRCEIAWEEYYAAAAAPCNAALQSQLARSVEAHGIAAHTLASGAGHDAMAMAAVAPMAMLFVRCGNGGISHHPDEILAVEDAEVATSVLLHFLEHFQAP
jgi:allantoate deiminase